MNTNTPAPAGVVSSTELGFLREWADASGTHFVCRSHGLQTTNTVSHDDLLQLVQAAVATERERCALLCDLLAKKCTGINARLAYRHAAAEIRGKQPNTTAEQPARAGEQR